MLAWKGTLMPMWLCSLQIFSRAIRRHVVDGMLADLGLVVDPELVAKERTRAENVFFNLTESLVEVGYSEDFLTAVVRWTVAGSRTLELTLGEEKAEEAIRLAVRSARVFVDPAAGVWDPGSGVVRPN